MGRCTRGGARRATRAGEAGVGARAPRRGGGSSAGALLALALALAATTAHAQDPEALYTRGVELREQGNDEAALEHFQRAYALAPSGRLLAQMGFAEQALGLWGAAHQHLTEARAHGEEWIRAHRSVIDDALAVIGQHVGQLEVRGGPIGAEVLVDGRVRGRLPLAAPLAITAGTTQLEVRAPGHAPSRRRVTIQAGQLSRETIQLVPGGGGGASEIMIITGIVGATLGVVGLGVGVGAFVVREENAVAYNECVRGEGDCSQEHANVQDAEVAMGVGFGVGGAVAVAGVVLLALGASGATDEQAHAGCGAGPGEIGLQCGVRF